MKVKGVMFVVALGAALLSGCQTTEWEVEGKCEGGSGSWNCSTGGKIRGTMQKNGVAGGMDAANFSIDLNGSTVGAPASGNVTISLVSSSTNSVQAAQVFAWIRSGSRLYLSNPTQVNAWAQANAGNADTLAYQLHPFDVTGVQSGENMLSVTAEYAGAPRAVSITTFSRGFDPCRRGGGYCQEQ